MEVGAVIKHDLKKAPKTGDWRYMKPVVDKSKCKGCDVCVPFCPEAAIILKRETHIEDKSDSTIHDLECAEIDYDFCKGCGVCANVCPFRAITMKKE